MLPINDTEPNRYTHFPYMTVFIIFINSVILFVTPMLANLSGGYWSFYIKYGFSPQLVYSMQGSGMLSSITAMFLHGGFGHLFSNMTAFWVFGRRVEDACGPWRFLVFYLLAGVCGDFMTAVVHGPNYLIPGIGASGAIFGIMGAYLLLYPGGRIRTLVFITIIPAWPRIRAFWIAFYFVGLQIIPALDVLFNKVDYNVGYWAHLGGFISAIFVFLFLRPEAFARYISDTSL